MYFRPYKLHSFISCNIYSITFTLNNKNKKKLKMFHGGMFQYVQLCVFIGTVKKYSQSPFSLLKTILFTPLHR